MGSASSHRVEFRLLGTVDVRVGECWPALPTKQRSLLAVLLLRANSVVPIGHLVDLLWDEPPAAAETRVRMLVSDLRKALGDDGPEMIVTRRPGYLVPAEPGQIDLDAFTSLVEQARAAGRPDAAVALYDEALALWRGPALAGTSGPFVVAEAPRLEELRLTATDESADVMLALGQHAVLVADLGRRAATHAFRERPHAQLMTALYRSGRRGDALVVYRRLRTRLVEELGLEPSDEIESLHRRILSGDPALDTPATTAAAAAPRTRPAPPPTRQLPAVGAPLVGRRDVVEQLDKAHAEQRRLLTVVGQAGVGKTSLVVHWAHRVAGRFPDGQFFLDMRGFDTAARMSAAEALTQLLHALGERTEDLPSETDELATLYRSLMADRQSLLILDNVDGADQVRPLLPGCSGSLVVLTSRDRLGGLVAVDDAFRLTLQALAPADALHVLGGLAGEDRVRAEPEAAEELARLCTYLPLILRIAGARLADQPGRPVRDYLDELVSEGRLAGLRVDGDRRACAREAFRLSYDALPESARLMFRLLSLVPTPAGVSPPAAAALAGVSTPRAADALELLARLHLVQATADGRYLCHDLLGEYAAELCEAADSGPARDAARRRQIEFSLHGIDRSIAIRFAPIPRLPRRPRPADVPEMRFAEARDARRWAEIEWPNLVAAFRHAAAAGPVELCWHLADAMHVHMALTGTRPEWRMIAQTGLAAACREADPLAEAAMRFGLGLLVRRTGEFRDALDEFDRAVALYRSTGWRAGEALALRNTGIALVRLGRPREAVDRFRRALAIDREIGDTAAEAADLSSLSAVHEELGDLPGAERYLTAVPMMVPGRGLHEATTLGNLGLLRQLQGRPAEAREALTASLERCRHLGARHAEGMALTTMGAVHTDTSRLAEADEVLSEALRIARHSADAALKVLALNGLAAVDIRSGRPDAALARLDESLGLAEQAGFLRGQVEALVAAAEAHCAQGEFRTGRRAAVDALAHADRAGSAVGLGRAHAALAAALLHLGELAECFDHARRALRVQRLAGQRLEQARTMRILAGAYSRAARPRAAEACARQARLLFEPASG